MKTKRSGVSVKANAGDSGRYAEAKTLEGVSVKANADDSGRYGETKIFPSRIAAQGSFRRQIILTFVVGFFLLVTAFTAYQFRTESAFLYRESTNETISLAESLAASSRSWVLANDVAGLQEVVHAFQAHPELRYAMVISPSGQVLAHSDATKIGQFVTDEQSLALIKSPPVNRVMIDDESISDIAVPIKVDQRLVGWARVGQERVVIADNLHKMMLSSVLFVLMSVVLVLFAALLIANRLGYRIGYLMRVAEEVQAGNYATRANIPGVDEIAKLANSFNHMLDVLARDEEQLRESEALLQTTMKILPVGLWVLDADGKIVFSNDAAKQIWAGVRYVGIEQLTEYKGRRVDNGRMIEPHEWAGARAVETGITSIEEEVEIECFDGTHKIILDSAVPLRKSDGSIRGAVTINYDISERKRAEKALRNSENRYRLLVQSAPMCIHEIGMDGRISSMNRAGLVMMGVEEECKVQGFLYLDAVCDADRERIGELLSKAYSGEASYFEFKASGPDGLIFKSCFVPIKNQNGGVEKLMGITEDITARKQAELEREQYFKFFNTSSDLMGIADPNGVFKKINPAFVKLLGYSEAEILAKPFIEFVHPDDRQPTLDEMARQLQRGFSLDFENRYICKDGSFRWLSWKGNVNYDEGLTYTTARDITERKHVEYLLEQREQEYRTLADNSPDVIVRYDREGRRIYVNPEFERVNRLTAQQVYGKTPAELSTELKPRADVFTEKLMAAMASGTVAKIDLSWTKDDKPICWFVRVVPEFDAGGKVVSALTIWSDISERKQAEEEIRKLNQELEQRVADRTNQLESANKELEAFSYSVSHDLRTPLRAIDGFSHILLDDYADKLDEEGRRLLKVVRDNTNRMGRLIDDILQFSRTGRVEISFAKIDMERLARDVFEELQSSVVGGKLQLEIDPLPPANGDRAMMHQVFINLLSNAIKFSHNREPAKIKVGGSIEGDEAVYYVKDNGAGFDMQYADKLFGVFQRLHGVNEFEGTGIGLAIVKRIITRHGGRVWAEGKPNEGATIYFSIPSPALH